MNQCPCGSGKAFSACCAPILAGAAATSPEAMMRSRYSAYVLCDVPHLERSLAPESRHDFDPAATEHWAKSVEWRGLQILSTFVTGADQDRGQVEFVAKFLQDGALQTFHERGRFRRHDGSWVYVDGDMIRAPVVRATPKLGRNEPCPCGSGKKYKHCCAGKPALT
jgi:SEC-C motif-containing protein